MSGAFRGRARSWRALPWRAACAVAVLAGTGCGSAPAAAPPPRRHVVEIRAMGFHPPELDVVAGDTVVWINRDFVPHTATSRTTGSWDTGQLAPEDSARLVVAATGGGRYLCILHPTMVGTITIVTGRLPGDEPAPGR